MLPKKNRVNKKTVEEIFKKGRFISSTNLTFKFISRISGKTSNNAQISFIAPKAVAKGAVLRNFLRRIGYLALEKDFKHFPDSILGVFLFNKGISKNIDLNTNIAKNKELKSKLKLELENDIKTIINKLH